jgi:hypothetical protein
MAEIVLSVTIDAEGKVQHVSAKTEKRNQKAFQLLQNSAIENISAGRSLSAQPRRTRK